MSPAVLEILQSAGIAGAILAVIVSLAVIWSRHSLAIARLKADSAVATLARGGDPDPRATNPGIPSAMVSAVGSEGAQHFEDLGALLRSSVVGEITLECLLPASIIDEEGIYVWTNDRLRRLLDREPARIHGHHFSEVSVPGVDSDLDLTQWSDLIKGLIPAQAYTIDKRSWRRLDGSGGWSPVTGRVVRALLPGVTWGPRRLRLVVSQIEDHSLRYGYLKRAEDAEERAAMEAARSKSLEELYTEERAKRDDIERERDRIARALTEARADLVVMGDKVVDAEASAGLVRRAREPRRQRTEVAPVGRVVIQRQVTPPRATPRLPHTPPTRPATALGMPVINDDTPIDAIIDVTPPSPPSGIRKPHRGEPDD